MAQTPPPSSSNGASSAIPTQVPKVTKTAITELGSTGLRRWGGYVDEEFTPALRGPKAVEVYREMASNDAVVGATLFAVEKLLRQASWRAEPYSQAREDVIAGDFLESNMYDMSHTWEDHISEVLSMLTYGWSWHEIVLKRRLGGSRNPMFRSEFNDGRIGWRKMPIRAQETMLEWEFDKSGGITGMVQLAPPEYHRMTIPMNKSVLFRTTTHKNNPEGRSILRNAYRSWYFLKRLQEIEGIGIERDLAGLPVAWIPANFMMPNASPDEKAIFSTFKRLVTSIRQDEQAGVVMPLEHDEDGNKLYDLELLSTGGSRQFDTDKPITRYEQRIAMTILADFILLGHDKVGSYSLGISKVGIFRTALNAWAQAIAAVINRHAVPQLFRVNGWNLRHYPKVVVSEIDPPSLADLGEFIAKVSGAGMPLFPDHELENHLRDLAKLPEKTEELEVAQEKEEQREDERNKLQAAMLNGDMPPEMLEEQGNTGVMDEADGKVSDDEISNFLRGLGLEDEERKDGVR